MTWRPLYLLKAFGTIARQILCYSNLAMLAWPTYQPRGSSPTFLVSLQLFLFHPCLHGDSSLWSLPETPSLGLEVLSLSCPAIGCVVLLFFLFSSSSLPSPPLLLLLPSFPFPLVLLFLLLSGFLV